MKKRLMSIPAIVIVSIVLPPSLFQLLYWIYSHNRGLMPTIAYDTMMFAIFVAYAGIAAYCRGRKIWHKLMIFAVLLIVQSVALLLYVSIDFAGGMAAFDAADQPPR
jgi:hypothetical protein